MEYVIKTNQRGKYILVEHESIITGVKLGETTRENATVFTNKNHANRIASVVMGETTIEPRYLKCKQCKNSCNIMYGKKPFLSCSKQVGVFPINAQFQECKHYTPDLLPNGKFNTKRGI